MNDCGDLFRNGLEKYQAGEWEKDLVEIFGAKKVSLQFFVLN